MSAKKQRGRGNTQGDAGQTGSRIMAWCANVVTLGTLAWTIAAPRLPAISPLVGLDRLNVVIQLALCTWVLYGILWSVAERCFGWHFGPGTSDRFPAGWAAVALSLSVTTSLAVVPPIYQRATGFGVIGDAHWRGMLLAVVLGALAHLIIYGTATDRPNGIRERIMPHGQAVSLSAGILCEGAYAIIFFPLIVLPYRLIVDPSSPLMYTLLVRTVVPASAFMMSFVFLVPDSTRDLRWAPARGIIGAGAMMFAFCGGMFL